MTTTDRRDAPAPSAAEQAVLDRIEIAPACDESAVERVARAIWAVDKTADDNIADWLSARDDYRDMARAAIDALKPAPGTDTSTEGALHRVLDLANELERPVEGLTGPDGPMTPFYNGRDVAFRIRAAVAGPQRDGEGDDQLRRCIHCGALCDHRVQACECGPDCPLPKVAR